MSTKRYKPEQNENLLRKIEVEIANGKKASQVAQELRKWSASLGTRTLYIEPGNP